MEKLNVNAKYDPKHIKSAFSPLEVELWRAFITVTKFESVSFEIYHYEWAVILWPLSIFFDSACSGSYFCVLI